MKKIFLVVLMVLMSFFVSCRGQIKTPKENVDTFIKNLKSYEASAEVVFTKQKKISTMKMQQRYDMKGYYELVFTEPESLKDYKVTYDGEKIYEYHPGTDKKVQAESNPAKNQVLFGTFVHNYLHVDHTGIIVKEEENTVSITLPIQGNYKYMAKETVWFDKKDSVPLKMAIYDQEGNVTIEITFTTFKYNVEIK